MVTRLRLHASDISSGPFLFTGTEMRLYKLSAGVFRWVSTWVCSGVLYNGSVLVRSVLLQFDVVNSLANSERTLEQLADLYIQSISLLAAALVEMNASRCDDM